MRAIIVMCLFLAVSAVTAAPKDELRTRLRLGSRALTTAQLQNAIRQNLQVEYRSRSKVEIPVIVDVVVQPLTKGGKPAKYSAAPVKVAPGKARRGKTLIPGGMFIPGDMFPGDMFIPGEMFFPGDMFDRAGNINAKGMQGKCPGAAAVLIVRVRAADPKLANSVQSAAQGQCLNWARASPPD